MNRIRVLYDEQIFLLQKYGGISRYFVELIKQFEENPDLGIDPVINVKWARNQYLMQRYQQIIPSKSRSSLQIVGSLIPYLFRNRTATESADLVHLTFYLPGFFQRFPNLPKVTTLFDMIPENRAFIKHFWNPHFSKKGYLRKSQAVVSISDTSTAEMRNNYSFNFPVTRTYLGVSEEFRQGLGKPSWAPPSYLIFVGNRSGYKNWVTAAKAFALVAKNKVDITLLLAGGGALTKAEAHLLGQLGLTDVVKHFDVSESEMPSLYSNALALLHPSKKEGFGLPVLEAMASGTPVIASDIPVNREICQNAALYFLPNDFKSLYEAIRNILEDPKKKAEVRKAGLHRASDFSWRKCAEQTAAVYKEVYRRTNGGL
jgi:glycosyltransferase involved in cell wall biosynthesis